MAYFFNKLFSKKAPQGISPGLKAIHQLDLYKSWVNAKGQVSHCPALYRLNLGLKPFIDHSSYPHEIVFSIELKEKDNHEMPLNKQEWEALTKIEQALVPRLHQNKESLLGLVVTTDGFQDLIFYSSNPKAAETKINSIKNSFSPHQTQLAITTGDWAHYKKFLAAFNASKK